MSNFVISAPGPPPSEMRGAVDEQAPALSVSDIKAPNHYNLCKLFSACFKTGQLPILRCQIMLFQLLKPEI
jgi:hypothetical protein